MAQWRTFFQWPARMRVNRVSLIALLLCGVVASACATVPAKPSNTAGGASHGASSSSSAGMLFTQTANSPALEINATGVATVSNVQLRVSIVCGPWVVLALHAPTYTQSEVAAISSFVAQHRGDIVGATDNYNGYTPGAVNPIPPTLRFVPGFPKCQGYYEVTNTGSALIQMSGIGFQPLQAPAPFGYHYDLLNACAFATCICPECGAAFGCAYLSTIAMTMSPSLAMGSFGSASDPTDCPALINLPPGTTVPVSLIFKRPAGAQAVWFRGVPAIRIVTSAGPRTLTYPSLPNNLVFADFGDHTSGATVGVAYPPSSGSLLAAQNTTIQVSCFAWSGNAFKAQAAFALAVFQLPMTIQTPGSHDSSSLCF